MTKWEYKEFTIIEGADFDLMLYLNRIGSTGWEVFKVGQLKWGNQFKTQILAKRCISPNETTNSSSPTTPESC